MLLTRGRAIFEELFPGLGEELAAHGVPMVDLHGEVHWYNDGYRMLRAPSDLIAIGMSRPLLEWSVRQRVLALPGVSILSRHEVVGPTADGRRITGVRVVALDGDLRERVITADLVVDTGGRATRSPLWLEQLGFRPPVEEQVRVGVTYVTGVFRREPQHLDGLLGALANAVPGAPWAGIVAVQERDRVAVALSGMLGEEPPTDREGMAAFAARLAAPQIAELLRTATPVTEPVRMRFPVSIRRRYERLRRFPDGYLVMADALCTFNPIYGQGMTVAALQAARLRQLLTSDGAGNGSSGSGDGLARRFFRDAAKLIDGPWSIAVGTDLRFPEVAGPRSLKVHFVNAYVHRLHRAATADPVLGAAFLRVLNLIDPPTALLAPSIMWRVLHAPPVAGRRRRPTRR